MQEALAQISARLENVCSEKLLTAYALIGGFAVARWGQPRFTDDIDFAVSVPEGALEPIAEIVEGTLLRGSIHDPLPASISYFEQISSGPLKVQLFQFYPAWETLVFENVHLEVIETLELPIIDWKALILIKLYAGGPHDLRDAEGILAVNAPSARELEYLHSKANSLRVNRKLEKLLRG